jgi:hypothetical protein
VAKPARSRGESLLAFFRFPFWWSRDRFDNEQRLVRLRAIALHFVPSLLLGPGVGQPLREPRDGGVSRQAAVGDCSNDPRGNEGERSQNADVALAETFAFGNLGQSCDAAEPKLFDPIPNRIARASKNDVPHTIPIRSPFDSDMIRHQPNTARLA